MIYFKKTIEKILAKNDALNASFEKNQKAMLKVSFYFVIFYLLALISFLILPFLGINTVLYFFGGLGGLLFLFSAWDAFDDYRSTVVDNILNRDKSNEEILEQLKSGQLTQLHALVFDRKSEEMFCHIVEKVMREDSWCISDNIREIYHYHKRVYDPSLPDRYLA